MVTITPMQLSILTDENQQKNAQNLRHKSCKKQNKKGNSLLLTCSRHRTLQNIRIPILQIFVFVFLSPFNKQKQKFGELEFEYFGGSDVVHKLYYQIHQVISQISRTYESTNFSST